VSSLARRSSTSRCRRSGMSCSGLQGCCGHFIPRRQRSPPITQSFRNWRTLGALAIMGISKGRCHGLARGIQAKAGVGG
jgi:hypothetical protein